jgi:hypothetical protein
MPAAAAADAASAGKSIARPRAETPVHRKLRSNTGATGVFLRLINLHRRDIDMVDGFLAAPRRQPPPLASCCALERAGWHVVVSVDAARVE